LSNIKLKDHNWAAEGIYDTNQSKSQQTINSDVNTKIGQATLQTSSQNLSGATNELKGRADTLDSKYDNVVTVANTQPSSQYNKVWLPLTVSEGTQVPTWAEHQALESSLNGAITSNEKAIAIIVDGDTCSVAVPSGGYAYVKNNTHGLTEGLYKNTSSSAFPTSGGTANSTVFTAQQKGGLNDLYRHSEVVSSGITGVSPSIINDSLVQIGFYITTPITVAAGGLTSIGTLPESVRPKNNVSYLLVFAKANNVPTVAGVRVASNGELLIYNIGASEVTFQTIQGVAHYSIL
jgi:hypothetical protein